MSFKRVLYAFLKEHDVDIHYDGKEITFSGSDGDIPQSASIILTNKRAMTHKDIKEDFIDKKPKKYIYTTLDNKKIDYIRVFYDRSIIFAGDSQLELWHDANIEIESINADTILCDNQDESRIKISKYPIS